MAKRRDAAVIRSRPASHRRGCLGGELLSAAGALIGAKIILPPHADVANAVGAVVGHVRIIRSATITEPSEGRFRINGLDGMAVHSSLEAAAAAATEAARALALADALRSGAAEPTVTVERKDKTVVADGMTVFVESVITAIAVGRPKLGS